MLQHKARCPGPRPASCALSARSRTRPLASRSRLPCEEDQGGKGAKLACRHARQVEAFDEVERAFVHVDYSHRTEPEHKARAAQCARHLRPAPGHDL